MLKKTLLVSIVIALAVSCTPKEKKVAKLYNSYCASCHIAPAIEDLPKEIWEKEILPEMGARLGIRENGYNPYEGLPFGEQSAIIATGIYPSKAMIPLKDWHLLKEYIIGLAPDSLVQGSIEPSEELNQFISKPHAMDSIEGSYATFMEYDGAKKQLVVGELSGMLSTYSLESNELVPLGQFGSAITSYIEKEGVTYITTIGILNPTDMVNGRLFKVENGRISPVINDVLHRPVHTMVHDLDNNGSHEIVVSEFGNLTGSLSLLVKDANGQYQKNVLLNQPGAIRAIPKDMDKDGKEDLVVLTGQGDEGITILYQENDLGFRAEKAIRISPVYGSSWFELIDYDGDGDDDIVTVHGDNADKSYVHKPYHGMRIHINNGKNEFTESYFYPLNGATRIVARDFDKDGDMDFGLLATFPDYENAPERTFVYLENQNTETYTFTSFTIKDANLGKWFLMDAADMDEDGDEDIILGSFTYPFTPAPEELSEFWKEKNIDFMVLENTANSKS